MLPPHELKNKTFTKVIRGYSSVEVDEHIDFIVQKYTELYRENDELDRKLKTVTAKLDQFKNDEESIRSALINAQRASSKILNEANERADMIVRSAKTNCDKIINEFRAQVKSERDTLYKLRQEVAQFKADIFEQYRAHIEYLDSISPDVDDSEEWAVSDDEYTRKVIENVKTDVAQEIAKNNADDSLEGYEKTDDAVPTDIYAAGASNVDMPVIAESAVDGEVAIADEKTKEIKIPESVLKNAENGQIDIDNTPIDEVGEHHDKFAHTQTFKIKRSSVNMDEKKEDVFNGSSDEGATLNDSSVKNAILELNKMLAEEEPVKNINQDDPLSALNGEFENDKVISDEDLFAELSDGSADKKNNKNSKKEKKHKLTSTQEFELVYGIDNGKNKK